MIHQNNNSKISPRFFKGPAIKQIKNPLEALNQLNELASHVKDKPQPRDIKQSENIFKDIKVLGYMTAILVSFGMMGYSCMSRTSTALPVQKNEMKLKTQLNERIKE